MRLLIFIILMVFFSNISFAQDPQPCKHQGRDYSNGQRITNQEGKIHECRNGTWGLISDTTPNSGNSSEDDKTPNSGNSSEETVPSKKPRQ